MKFITLILFCCCLSAGAATLRATNGKVATLNAGVWATSDITDSLVGWWKFDDGAGTNAVDSSGNSHAGDVYGSTWMAGKVGTGSLYFAANTDYVEIANPGTHLDATNFSVLSWVNWTNAANSYARVVDRVYNGSFACYLVSASAGSADPCMSGSLITDAGGVDYGSGGITGTGLNTNVWVHLGWTWDGTNVRCYTNGALAATISGSPASGALSTSSSLIRISQRADAGEDRGFTGWLDDVRLYSRCLSSSEVSAVYSVTK